MLASLRRASAWKQLHIGYAEWDFGYMAFDGERLRVFGNGYWSVSLNAGIAATKTLLIGFQPVRHSDESGQRVGLHFFHYVAAMNFHRVFAGPEFHGYLFIQQARNH